MITIRKKFSRPIIILIILIPLSILVLFNLTVSYYAQTAAENELLHIAQDAASKLSKMASSNQPLFKVGPSSSSMELIIYNRQGNVSKFSAIPETSFVTSEIAQLAYTATADLPIGEIGKFNHNGHDYYFVELDIQPQMLRDKAIYVSESYFLDDFVFAINLLLLIISVIVTIIATFISTRITTSIASPIEYITKCVESIKYDEILHLNIQNDAIEFQKLSLEINKMSKRIYDAHNSQKMFLNNASHELRTPLMSIRGYADGIEMGIFADTKSTAHIISEETQKLTTLIDGLLTLGRIENFNDADSLVSINLNNYLSDLVNTYNGYALSKNITINNLVTTDVSVRGNDELLRAVFGNIISNGLRYAKTTIDISATVSDTTATIFIKNDGEKITNQDKIFERFSKGKNGNFGLGLSIAKTSIEKLNGHIRAYNDQGVIFEITIPTT
ncbi:sensor histidine kinase [Candidatus Epulonipiscium viviparus]|uniref:sensor histidine kinase n=1 Tax=Candidatus Epulonipiscium viviparus TaxID=420336 RepID=UPI00273806FB|nr:HAMP domain-containing sensor histidine kinase [Candidatus Epulopiscium viviparus]